MSIGKAIKTFRESKQWSLVELSVHSGLGKEHLKRVEQGEAELPPPSVEKLSRLFNVPVHVFNYLGMDEEDIALANKFKKAN